MCDKPEDLDPENELPYFLWRVCNMFGREGLTGNMSVVALLHLCQAYGQPLSVFQRVLALEEAVERIREAKRRESKEKESHGE